VMRKAEEKAGIADRARDRRVAIPAAAGRLAASGRTDYGSPIQGPTPSGLCSRGITGKPVGDSSWRADGSRVVTSPPC
jgi:hypothetical protein